MAQKQLIQTDINAYLQAHLQQDILRLLTCGSVDDGKSTLIGRLLFDSQQVLDDQLASLHQDNARLGNAGEHLDWALLVDGLAAEREQGITIDVAYRYFATEKRKFIIADTPGHEQYTRNMATGASKCDLAIVMVDANKGISLQTRRHSYICNLLGIRKVVVAINKMDMVGFSEAVFNDIRAAYRQLAALLDFESVEFIPISALNGDNVVTPSSNTPWYQGLALLAYLEQVPLPARAQKPLRFGVQYVNRANAQFRGYAGTVTAGNIHVGDELVCLPSGARTQVTQIIENCQSVPSASAQQAITITLKDELDISRGDMFAKADALAQVSNRFTADVVWMSAAPLVTGREYYLKFASKVIAGCATEIKYSVDINQFAHQSASELALNAIGRVEFELASAIALDEYQHFKHTGSFIIIDRMDNATCGAGMVREVLSEKAQKNHQYSDFERELNALIRRHYPQWQCQEI